MTRFTLLLTAFLAAAVPVRAASPDALYRDEEIAPGVHAVVMLDPLGLANHSNAVFIVSGDDVILVDTQFTLERTRAVLDRVRAATDKPVGVLINTHWHDDHTFGNQVIRAANPKVEIIAHMWTKRDMAEIGVANRKEQVAGAPDALVMFGECVKNGKTVDGRDMSPEERTAYESTIAIVNQYLTEMPGFELTLPTKTFEDQLVLTRGKRTIEIRHLGPAVTEGDAVVWLPAERILITGDIFDSPVPFSYRCNVGGWVEALDAIRELDPAIIVPGHGPVLRGLGEVDQLKTLLTSIRDETAAAVGRGETLDRARAAINMKSFRGQFAGDNAMLGFLFDNFFVGPAVQSAFNEASAK
ncbi:MAG TPA: MBL fold metallo-hydrolase [Candidatus Krumholzibacteria bacterium]